MEFLDDDTRPRFLFQSRTPPPTSSPTTDPQTISHAASKPFLFVTISLSSLLLILSLFVLQSEPSKSLLLWLSLSLLLGPFAPISLTGGDIRVGRGRIVEFPNESSQSDDESKKRAPQKRPKARRSEDFPTNPSAEAAAEEAETLATSTARESKKNEEQWEEKEWNEEEIEVLKKQLAKNPVGKPRRWEAIAEAFRGRHKVESVIRKAKELGERKLSDADSYSEFLKKRKPVDKRIAEENQGPELDNNAGVVWSSGEDIALLNALKAFPKDAPMRWEKIAAAVAGKSKAACVKRVADLKRDFRSSKSAAAVVPES